MGLKKIDFGILSEDTQKRIIKELQQEKEKHEFALLEISETLGFFQKRFLKQDSDSSSYEGKPNGLGKRKNLRGLSKQVKGFLENRAGEFFTVKELAFEMGQLFSIHRGAKFKKLKNAVSVAVAPSNHYGIIQGDKTEDGNTYGIASQS